MLKVFEDKRIGFVNYGGIKAGQVDLGGCFAVVAHPFGYDRERNTLGFGGGCLAMTSDVEGQRDGDSNHSCDAFQAVVDVVAGVAVGASLIEFGIANDRKQVFALVFGILVENYLHLLCPFYNQLLAGLAAPIGCYNRS